MPASIWLKLAPRTRKVLFRSIDEATRQGADQVTAEHLLLAMTSDDQSAAAFVLERAGAPTVRVREMLDARLGGRGTPNGRPTTLASSARRALELAEEESRKLRHLHVGTEHLLLGLIVGTSGPAGDVLDRLGVTYDTARSGVQAWRSAGMPRGAKPPMLRQLLPAAVRGAIERLAMPAWHKISTGYKVFVGTSIGHPGFVKDPYPLYRRLRRRCPIRRDPLVGVWVITSYDETLAMLRDSRFQRDPFNLDHLPPGIRQQLGLADNVKTYESTADLFSLQMLFLDPPKHTRLRGLLAKSFTPRVVQNLRPRIQELTDLLLDKVRGAGSMDVIRDLAYPLPTMVIAELLGFPAEDYERLKVWSDDFAALLGFNPTDEQQSKAMQSLEQIQHYFETIVARLKVRPRDNLLSALLTVDSEGDRLSPAELFANCILLLAAGHETTTNLIGNGMLALLRNPDQLKLLRRDPSLIVNAVEELLRYDSPVQWTSRVAAQTIELGGKTISQGDFVLASLGAANRDPKYFPDPDRLDITRPVSANKHLAFGSGIHFCLGAALARMEGQIAIGSLVSSFPTLRLGRQRLRWHKGVVFRGLESLNVTFSA